MGIPMTQATEHTKDCLYDVLGAAVILSVSRATIFKLVSTGALRCVRIGERATRFRSSELDRYMAALPDGRGIK
jgi:excisionase family DNA binding protein